MQDRLHFPIIEVPNMGKVIIPEIRFLDTEEKKNPIVKYSVSDQAMLMASLMGGKFTGEWKVVSPDDEGNAVIPNTAVTQFKSAMLNEPVTVHFLSGAVYDKAMKENKDD